MANITIKIIYLKKLSK